MTDPFVKLMGRYDPAVMAEAMATHGSLWTDAHRDMAALRCLALSDHEPGDGTPEGAELAAITARKEEHEAVLFGDDEEDGEADHE